MGEPMTHHPLCMSLWSGCPDENTCRACPSDCKECTWEQETCECYTHAEDESRIANREVSP